jgi:predicted DNA-binding protein with PD1-like motif
VEVSLAPSSLVVARLHPGEELLESIKNLSRKYSISGGLVVAIGGLKHLEMGVYKVGKYDVQSFDAGEGETIELTSAIGSVALDEKGDPSPHIHVTASLPNHQPVSGHLIKGVVSPLVEVFIVSASGTLRRLPDQSLGLPALTA